ncbi:MAG: site-2 protease family protein [Candidatus Pacebacteria bacterium]|jgi:regulator of sigma E protease|nr:site-2 protease family protein [Candidatus Paceibacterota bacterium]
MDIILFIVILAALILVHELGHFTAAKRAGVRVDEFGLGFPPRLWKKKIGETVYSLNAFPVGGFVKIFGENPDEESLKGKDSSRSLTSKNRGIQAWIMSAGIIFNLLFAWLLVSVGFMIGLPFSADDTKYGARVEDPIVMITQVLPGSPAEEVGLKGGDTIVALYGGADVLETPRVESTQKFIAGHKEFTLAYLRDKKIQTITVEPKEGIVDGRLAIGVSMDSVGTLTLPVHEALYAGVLTTASMTAGMAVGIVDFLKNIFIGQADFKDVAGPVGIVGIVSDASALGIAHLISLTAIISINLAIINLLPFPALDGGRLFFLLIEAIKRSPIKPEVANIANGIGFIVLILFMVFVTFHDVMKIIQG